VKTAACGDGLEALSRARALQKRISQLESGLERANVELGGALSDCCELLGEERTVRELGLHPNAVRAMVRHVRRRV
jgi:hypothetical protein